MAPPTTVVEVYRDPEETTDGEQSQTEDGCSEGGERSACLLRWTTSLEEVRRIVGGFMEDIRERPTNWYVTGSLESKNDLSVLNTPGASAWPI